MKAGAKILVGGAVQGVGFRTFIYGQASRLGLVGFTRNLPGGEVEIELEGERAIIQAFLSRARQGPPMARVDSLQVEWRDGRRGYSRFEIRH